MFPLISRRFGQLCLLLTLLPLLLVPVQPAAAQTPANPDSVIKFNPDGGESPTDGLEVWVGPGAWNIKRNGEWQIYSFAVEDAGVDPDDAEYAPATVGDLQVGVVVGDQVVSIDNVIWGDYNDPTKSVIWTTATLDVLPLTAPNYGAVAVMSAELDALTFSVIVTTTYTSPNNYIDVDLSVVPGDAAPTSDLDLYVAGDWYLDGSDEGPGIKTTDDAGRLLVAQYNETAIGGFIEMAGSPWTSWFEGSYMCAFGYWDEYYAIGCKDGPFDGSSYTNTVDPNPSYVEGIGADAGVGAHWALTSAATSTRSIRYFFDSKDAYISNAPAQCQLTPDMAVNPQFIELLPNGTARIEVSLRNLCNDAPYNNSDLLLSLNDGLTVVDGSPAVVKLGQRAAVQGLSLNPGETRTYFFIVQAGAVVPTGPTHISELYNGGRIARRIDGVFLTPPPAPPAVVAEVPAEIVAPAFPAALPATLPNTAGDLPTVMGLLQIGLGVLLILGGAWYLTRRNPMH